MKTLGLFEAKTRFSEICAEVAETGAAVTVTRRGRPLVRIEPVTGPVLTIAERRARYNAEHQGQDRADSQDFEPPARSRESAADLSLES